MHVVVLVGLSMGMVVSLQTGIELARIGQQDQIGTLVALSMAREMGPFITATVLSAAVGSALAAELGTMVVGEEIEALEAHALNPIRFLVLPRMFATTLCVLVLCVFGELVALTSGWSVGVFFLDVPSRVYIDNTITQLDLADFFTGLFKAGIFGVIIGAIACYNGLAVTGGAAGVGRATTNTVVHAIVAIIGADLLFTAVFYRLEWN